VKAWCRLTQTIFKHITLDNALIHNITHNSHHYTHKYRTTSCVAHSYTLEVRTHTQNKDVQVYGLL